jgi:hypothetical protein
MIQRRTSRIELMPASSLPADLPTIAPFFELAHPVFELPSHSYRWTGMLNSVFTSS